MSDPDDLDDTDLADFLEASGFKIVPIQAVIDALAEMERYLKEQAGISQEELEALLVQIETLVGREEAMRLELDEILGWIRAIKNEI